MHPTPGSIRKALLPLLTLWLTALPAAAAAAEAATGPTKKEIVLFSLLALAMLGLTLVLYRLAYGFFLDRSWPVDFAIGVALFLCFVGLASTFLFVYLQLWPQPWGTVAWYVDLSLVVLLLVVALVGHFRHSA
ncbi:MAG TPA: hypothetical protein VD969_07300 [Symbiobacteriaceae bacterium]|nr:hypothetical protein [Symbiobacteriaceae bacterium]